MLASPIVLLVLVVALCAGLLMLPLYLPLGPNYWDMGIYLDGAHRIALGQLPGIDFDAPVGPLGYYLMYWGQRLFPNGQSLLLVQFSMLVVTAPLMGLIVADVDRRSRLEAFALLLPFLFFSLLPFNIQAYSTYPGVDGYGIYNRQVCVLLYVLVAGLLYVQSRIIRNVVLLTIITALFFVKITGFSVAGLIALLALTSGRLRFVDAVVAGTAFLLVLGAVELSSGLVSAYLEDIFVLVSLNTGTLLPRFLTVVSTRFDVVFMAGLLVLALFVLNRGSSKGGIADFLDQPVIWLMVVLFAGIIFETQNTGSQDFIFLWPVLLRILLNLPQTHDWKRWTMAALVAAVALPTAITVMHRAARVIASSPKYVRLELPALGAFGRVSTKQVLHERMTTIGAHYAANKAAYRDLASIGQLPSWTFYSEISMQGAWLIDLQRVAERLLAYEKENGLRFNSLYVLDFTNPLASALGRDIPRHVQIGLDPFRTMAEISDKTREALMATDAILAPLCPITTARVAIRANYKKALKGRVSIALNPCWELLLKPEQAKLLRQ